VTPEITPAVSSVARFLGTTAVRTESTTTASTMAPTTIPSARSDTTASTQIPPRVPAARPVSAQDTPGQSACSASLARISTGRLAPATSIEPGMSAGSSSVTTGAAISPRPRPRPLCTNPPRATRSPATAITTSGLTPAPTLPAPAARASWRASHRERPAGRADPAPRPLSSRPPARGSGFLAEREPLGHDDVVAGQVVDGCLAQPVQRLADAL